MSQQGGAFSFPVFVDWTGQKEQKELEDRNLAPGCYTGRNSAMLSQKSSRICAESALTGKNKSLIRESTKDSK